MLKSRKVSPFDWKNSLWLSNSSRIKSLHVRCFSVGERALTHVRPITRGFQPQSGKNLIFNKNLTTNFQRKLFSKIVKSMKIKTWNCHVKLIFQLVTWYKYKLKISFSCIMTYSNLFTNVFVKPMIVNLHFDPNT